MLYNALNIKKRFNSINNLIIISINSNSFDLDVSIDSNILLYKINNDIINL